MRIAESAKLLDRAAQIERALRVERGHQDGFFRAENFRRFSHKAHAGDQQRRGRMSGAEARHLQRIGDTAAGLFGQLLNFRVGIVMGHHHRIALAQQAFNFFAIKVLLIAV